MRTIQNTIEVACSAQTLYDYITQPWLWHEWHPNSKGAKSDVTQLQIGDSFKESLDIQLLGFIPIKRTLHYQVVAAKPYTYWEIKATTNDGFVHFKYDYVPTEKGVSFTRTLHYEVTGILSLLLPILHRNNVKASDIAMTQLKQRAEQLATAS